MTKIELGVVVTVALAIISGVFYLGYLNGRLEAVERAPDRLREATDEVRQLRKEAMSLPAGAVVAFADSPTGETKTACADLGTGWEDFKAADGKFILGAGQSAEKLFKSGDKGGEYSVVLNENNLPAHSHPHSHKVEITEGSHGNKQPVASSGRGSRPSFDIPGYGFVRTDQSTAQSSSTANEHENMPPYVVLTWCKYTG